MADLSALSLPELQREVQFTSDAYGLLERMADEAPAERQVAYGVVLRDLYNRLNGPTGLKSLIHNAIEENR